MINRIKIIGVVLFNSLAVLAQTPVGHTTITFNDPARTGGYGSGGGSGRQIQTEIYYPAASAGDDVPVVGSNLPVIAFGHGFVMSWDAYQNIWEALVNEGYVVAFPRTEGGFSPVHADFGLDLAQIIPKMQALNTNAASLFFGKLASTSAIMGHSMGGGSSFLAGLSSSQATTMVTLAAANTNPASITAAQQISIPNLVISGVNDCVAPPDEHQDLMYDSLASQYKTQVNIIGGGHCYFANTNFNCSFGEGTCSPNPTISRGEQQDATMDFAALWLRKFLKNDCNAADDFQDSLLMSSRITYRQNNPINCSSVGMNDLMQNNFSVYPNPATDELFLQLNFKSSGNIHLEIFEISGKKLLDYSGSLNIPEANAHKADIRSLSGGLYFYRITDGDAQKSGKLMVK